MARSTHRKKPEQLTLDAVLYHSGRGGPRHDHVQAQTDQASSGRWFDGWCTTTAPPNPADTCEVAPARTWLLHTGWRRHGLIDPVDVP